MRSSPSRCSLAAVLCLVTILAGCGGAESSEDASAAGTLGGAATENGVEPSGDEALAERSFLFTYRAVVEEIPDDADRVRVWLPYPTGDEHQSVEVEEIAAPVPHEVHEEPEYGNRVLYLEVDDPERDSLEVVMRARVHRREVLRKEFGRAADHGDPGDDPELAMWLEPDALVPLDERITSLSEEVTAGAETDVEKARAIYDYVVSNMDYNKEGTGWGRGDIYWACDAKRGNCTDFHALFTGLCRAAGIPAKFAIGFPIPAERGEGEVGGYHCWSEFHLDGYGWVPVDASEAAKAPEKTEYYFGGHDENRVELTEGRDLVLRPEQAGDPLNFFVYPYVEVDGEPHEAVSHSFSYRDLAEEDGAETAATAP